MKHINKFDKFLNRESVNEFFGMSKGERELKKLKRDISIAKTEVDNMDLGSVFRKVYKGDDNNRYNTLSGIIISNVKQSIPTFLKLFPEILNGVNKSSTNVTRTRFDYGDVVLDGVTLSSLSPFLTPKNTDNINKLSKENMKKRLDGLIEDM